MKLNLQSSVSLLTFVTLSCICSCGKDKAQNQPGTGGQENGGQENGGQENGGTSAQGGNAGNAGNAGSSSSGGSSVTTTAVVVTIPPDTSVPAQPWDYTGIIGSGQSLAVGGTGKPIISTTPSYNNLKLSTGTLGWPVDPADESLSMVPLVEPVGRPSTTYPSSWPTNIDGETAHTSMASQVTSMVKSANGGDYIGVHGEFGESGQCMNFLIKGAVESGVNGRAYAASLVETQAVTRLATAAGKTYGVGALIMTHGECDAGNKTYEEELYQLLTDYNTDVAAITGQTKKFPLILSQQNSGGVNSPATQAQWQIGAHHPTEAVCSGPKYHLPYSKDNIHLTAEGYRLLGEKYGQVYYERVVQGRDWQPLYPTSVERDGQVITVHFHVPVPPLAWETTFSPTFPDVPKWKDGKGFEVRGPAARYTITSVEIVGDSVKITCAEELPETGIIVGYAMTANTKPLSSPFAGTTHWGLLRDSDPFFGSVTGKPQPNYAVAFYWNIP